MFAISCINLNLVQRVKQLDESVEFFVNSDNSSKSMQILDEHNDVFEGVDHLPDKHKIVLNEGTISLVALASCRKVPCALQGKVKNEFLPMEKDGIIKRVMSTDCVNPIVIVPKRNDTIPVI